MKDTLAIICNYNRKNDVVNLIKSLQQQDSQFFDILVVDNSSTDDSIPHLKGVFPLINYLQNSENLGGSGGFNAGLKYCLKHNYKYFILLDSDITLKHNCLSELRNSLLSDSSNGVIGSKILFMNNPNKIQATGAKIDWQNLKLVDLNYGCLDNDSSEIFEVDYIPACTLMARVEILKKIGLFKEDYFLYFDDVEWCSRIAANGWKILVNTKAVTYHRGGNNQNTNSNVQRFYYTRNSCDFFTSHASYKIHSFSDIEIESRAEQICKNIFKFAFGSYSKGLFNIQLTFIDALDCAIECRLGRISDKYVRTISNNTHERFDEIVNNIKGIVQIDLSELEDNLKNYFKLQIDKTGFAIKYIEKNNEVSFVDSNKEVVTFKAVNSIYDYLNIIDLTKDNTFFIDAYFNVVSNTEELTRYKSYDQVYKFFLSIYKGRVNEKIKNNQANSLKSGT